ncbi:leucine-rich repeat domain-containing protein [Mariniflexile fucanivorans]|nr:leucine-rich repeat protein [Mariniflexile fucanivorans]
MKKTLQLFVALMVTATMSAQFTVDNISYSIVSGTDVQVTGSTLAAVLIPSTVDDSGTTYTVTTIATSAFQNNTTIASVVTPSTLTTIGANTFRSTTNLVSVDFSASNFTVLPGVTFRQSGIQSIKLPASLTTIENNAFRQCTKLTSVTVLNDTPITINQYAFNSFVDDGAAGTNLPGATLNVPSGKTGAYDLAAYWTEFGIITDGVVTLSTNKLEQELGFSFYPNPTNGVVSIKSKQLNNANVGVYDLNGRELLNKTISGTSSEINISNLASGIYLFKVQVEDAAFTKRIVKQ